MFFQAKIASSSLRGGQRFSVTLFGFKNAGKTVC